MLTAHCVMGIGCRVESQGIWGSCVDSILCYGDSIQCGKGRDWGNFELTADYVSGMG